MRGRAWCGRHDGFTALRKVRNDLVGVPIGDVERWREFFFGAGAASAELAVRQLVIERFGGVLTRALYEYLGGGGAIKMAMPRAWRDYLSKNGWRVNHFRSATAWYWVMLLRLVHGAFSAFRISVALCRSIPAEKRPQLGPHVMFESLVEANLPQDRGAERSYDICSFYARWPGRRPGITTLCHGVDGAMACSANDLSVQYRPPVWKLAGGWRNALRLAWWALRASAIAAMQLLAGQWQYALLLAEAARARSVRMCPRDVLAEEYLFHASGTIYRPLWTYEAQRQGSGVTLYFYSAYDQPKLASGYEPQRFEWGPANWPRYIVWDEYQEAVLRRDLGDDITLVRAGVITFSDSEKPMPALPGLPVAIFDIQPHRKSLHVGITTLHDCHEDHPDYFLRFLQDTAEVIRECGGSIVLKNKRYIGGRSDRQYKRALDRLTLEDDVRMVDPAISAMRVAKACVAGISAPFTSTAIHLRECGIPSVYYDPAGWMQRDDRAAHGIPILQGKAELLAWLRDVIESRALPLLREQGTSC